jgi:CBS-domain-containing membrane protein
MDAERFARRMFRGAALYGLLVLPPMYLLPPPAERAEAYYGFIGSALAFQAVYWTIGGDPRRYRSLMPWGALAKLSFAVPALTLFAAGRLEAPAAALISIDVPLALGFLLAWRRTAPA